LAISQISAAVHGGKSSHKQVIDLTTGPDKRIEAMKRRDKRFLQGCRRFHRRTHGMGSVEFAILGTVLMMFIGGVVDFGHAWFIKQVITNASRGGARYAVAYDVDSTATRKLPNALSPNVATYVASLAPNLITTSNVAVSGSGYTDGIKGHPVTVTVSVTKSWFLLSGILPSGTLPATLAASTTMTVE
jgi:Flp pilus assembly protein TadG